MSTVTKKSRPKRDLHFINRTECYKEYYYTYDTLLMSYGFLNIWILHFNPPPPFQIWNFFPKIKNATPTHHFHQLSNNKQINSSLIGFLVAKNQRHVPVPGHSEPYHCRCIGQKSFWTSFGQDGHRGSSGWVLWNRNSVEVGSIFGGVGR